MVPGVTGVPQWCHRGGQGCQGCQGTNIPYARHHSPLLIRNRSWILTIHKPLEKTFFGLQKVGKKYTTIYLTEGGTYPQLPTQTKNVHCSMKFSWKSLLNAGLSEASFWHPGFSDLAMALKWTIWWETSVHENQNLLYILRKIFC